MTDSYTIVVERDPESGWLVAEVVELPGCYSQAPDLSSLEANVREAIAAYIEDRPLAEDHPEFIGTWRVQIPA